MRLLVSFCIVLCVLVAGLAQSRNSRLANHGVTAAVVRASEVADRVEPVSTVAAPSSAFQCGVTCSCGGDGGCSFSCQGCSLGDCVSGARACCSKVQPLC
jgi:hypothetical protein